MYGGQKEVVNMSDYAPNPDKIPMYEQLNTLTLYDDAISTAINLIVKNMKVQGINQDDMIALKIINDATFRSDSGPVPNTVEVKRTVSGTDGDILDILAPAEGEVWQLTAMSSSSTGAGASRIIVSLENPAGEKLEIFDRNESSSTAENNVVFSSPIYITKECKLIANFITVETTGTIMAAYCRIR